MEYMVVGIDGNEYGPSNIDTLRQWAAENRIQRDSVLKNFATGQTLKAAEVPGLFASAAEASFAPPAPVAYPRPAAAPAFQTNNNNDGLSDVLW